VFANCMYVVLLARLTLLTLLADSAAHLYIVPVLADKLYFGQFDTSLRSGASSRATVECTHLACQASSCCMELLHATAVTIQELGSDISHRAAHPVWTLLAHQVHPPDGRQQYHCIITCERH